VKVCDSIFEQEEFLSRGAYEREKKTVRVYIKEKRQNTIQERKLNCSIEKLDFGGSEIFL